MFYIDFVVSGNGSFPMDMLRYDRCYPVDGSSAADMHEPRPNSRTRVREVRLRIFTENEDIRPTRDRWTSFGWAVGPVNTRRF